VGKTEPQERDKMPFFSERERGSPARIVETISIQVWGGIVLAVQWLVEEEFFAQSFPSRCDDDASDICGTHARKLSLGIQSMIPGLDWPLEPETLPNLYVALDLLEFCYTKISKPANENSWHKFLSHYHYEEFDASAAKTCFVNQIEDIFRRNGIAFRFNQVGEIERIPDSVLAKPLSEPIATGDEALDELLRRAREMFMSHVQSTRADAVEKLWDAFERVKTLDLPDKKASMRILLAEVAENESLVHTIEKGVDLTV
jgi:hypothetical protein